MQEQPPTVQMSVFQANESEFMNKRRFDSLTIGYLRVKLLFGGERILNGHAVIFQPSKRSCPSNM